MLLGLRENWVYFAEIILRISERNCEKVLGNRKNFSVISEKFRFNLENNEEIFGKSEDSFQKLGKD